jgi:cell division protein FtsB
MRWLTLALGALLILVQYPLWIGKGGWIKVAELEQHLEVQRDTNAKLRARNDAMDADVKDLKSGTEAIEERARSELGMVKSDEIFVQVLDAPKPSLQSEKRIAATAERGIP